MIVMGAKPLEVRQCARKRGLTFWAALAPRADTSMRELLAHLCMVYASIGVNIRLGRGVHPFRWRGLTLLKWIAPPLKFNTMHSRCAEMIIYYASRRDLIHRQGMSFDALAYVLLLCWPRPPDSGPHRP